MSLMCRKATNGSCRRKRSPHRKPATCKRPPWLHLGLTLLTWLRRFFTHCTSRGKASSLCNRHQSSAAAATGCKMDCGMIHHGKQLPDLLQDRPCVDSTRQLRGVKINLSKQKCRHDEERQDCLQESQAVLRMVLGKLAKCCDSCAGLCPVLGLQLCQCAL